MMLSIHPLFLAPLILLGALLPATASSEPRLEVLTAVIGFGPVAPGSTMRIDVIVVAREDSVIVTGFDSRSERFLVSSPSTLPIILEPDERLTLTIEFRPTDFYYAQGAIWVETDARYDPLIFAWGGMYTLRNDDNPLNIHRPSHRDQLRPEDTVAIEWSGVLPTDLVHLEFSSDAGATWSTITRRASGLQHRWIVPSVLSGDCMIRATLWRPDSLLERDTLPVRHDAWPLDGDFSRDGRWLVTGRYEGPASSQGIVDLWDAESRSIVRSDTLARHNVYVATFSNDSRLLALGHDADDVSDTSMRIIDVTSGDLLSAMTGSSAAVWYARFSPDDRFLATAGHGVDCRIWDVASGTLVRSFFDTLASTTPRIAWSADGRRFALASYGSRRIRMYDAETWTVLLDISTVNADGIARFVTALDFSPDGRWLLTATNDQDPILFDVATGAVTDFLIGLYQPNRVMFNLDGRIAMAARDTVVLWDSYERGQLLAFKTGDPRTDAILSSDGASMLRDLPGGSPVIYTFAGSAIDADSTDGAFGIGMPAAAELESGPVLSVRPNPVTGELRIVMDSEDETIVELIDLLGRRVLRQHFDDRLGRSRSIDLRGVPSGAYNVVIRHGGRVAMKQIVVQ
ncbi:MAG TPA: T9SS type A sorting domain-containing protein [Candidatus Kapabacteria bacterium]|jgi:WD40 repeat protein|nr:T9SS type A sorting domain-containing protein [Candidatus Kapabacteria bacterium]